jgi:4-diphosphocytidyl-2-C-methyl-D-erythritol kinase
MTTISAQAKLTVSLQVTGVRADGYHLIDAEMMSLDLADTVTIDPHGDGLVFDGPFSAGITADENNLVARALRLVGRTARVTVTKNIPHGGGLGGGSADAAAILAWAGFDDLQEASRLGADIPFCLIGGRARVRGIGEVIEPLSFEPRDFTLVIPPFAVSTPAVYGAWDAMPKDVRGRGVNGLEAAAISVEPRLAVWRAMILNACGVEPVLAGSGSTWWLPGSLPEIAERLPQAHVVTAKSAYLRR